MASSQIFNITSASDVTDSTGEHLNLLITPQPTTVNGTSVASPYTVQYVIPSPTAAQKAKYVYGGTITLTTDT